MAGSKLSIRVSCVSGSRIAETEPASTIAFLAVTEAAESGFSIVGVHWPQHAGGATTVGSASARGQQSEHVASTGAVRRRPSRTTKSVYRKRFICGWSPGSRFIFSRDYLSDTTQNPPFRPTILPLGLRQGGSR
jgi:hypothetical protein